MRCLGQLIHSHTRVHCCVPSHDIIEPQKTDHTQLSKIHDITPTNSRSTEKFLNRPTPHISTANVALIAGVKLKDIDSHVERDIAVEVDSGVVLEPGDGGDGKASGKTDEVGGVANDDLSGV